MVHTSQLQYTAIWQVELDFKVKAFHTKAYYAYLEKLECNN